GGARREPRAYRRPTRRRPSGEHSSRAYGRVRRARRHGPAHGTGSPRRSNRCCASVGPEWRMQRAGSQHRSGEPRVTLWSGRFDTAPDPAAFDLGISFGFDRALFEDDVTGSLAWAEALAAAGVLSADDASAIQAALR